MTARPAPSSGRLCLIATGMHPLRPGASSYGIMFYLSLPCQNKGAILPFKRGILRPATTGIHQGWVFLDLTPDQDDFPVVFPVSSTPAVSSLGPTVCSTFRLRCPDSKATTSTRRGVGFSL